MIQYSNWYEYNISPGTCTFTGAGIGTVSGTFFTFSLYSFIDRLRLKCFFCIGYGGFRIGTRSGTHSYTETGMGTLDLCTGPKSSSCMCPGSGNVFSIGTVNHGILLDPLLQVGSSVTSLGPRGCLILCCQLALLSLLWGHVAALSLLRDHMSQYFLLTHHPCSIWSLYCSQG